jgi:3-oxoacyl-(acyl-carrier-protein) synthase
MSRAWIAAAALAAASLCVAPAARADDPAPRRAPPGTDGAKPGGDAPKADEPKKDPANLRVERAKQLVKELEEAVARAKSAQPIDAQMLQILMTALDQAKLLAKPAKPDELTQEEKQAVVDESKKQPDAGAPKDSKDPKDPMADWQEKAMEKAFADADLSEEESIKAKKIVGEWWKENLAAMGDSKKSSDLKRKRDDDLEKALGKKKAQKVINNLNAMGPGRGR